MHTRVIFRVYAVAALLLGAFLLGTGRVSSLGVALQPAALVTTPSEASPYGLYVVPRVTGIVLLTIGLLALAFGRLDDPEARWHSLNRFAAAHVLFGVLFSMVGSALLGLILPAEIIWGPLVVGGVLACFAVASAPVGPRGLAGETLRSRYEEQIRLAARREERARLARDLHDAVKQQLFVIQTAAATVEARLAADREGAQEAVEYVRTAARQATTEMEALIGQLKAPPMENAGLIDAIRTQCEALGFRTGANVELRVGDLPPSESLFPGTQEALYRFAQEALANIGRHARAGSVIVTLDTKEHDVQLTIADDGLGFEPGITPEGMGLRNMASRAAELGGWHQVTSERGRGTTVTCAIPGRPGPWRRALRAAAWAAGSAAIGFFVYTQGGVGGSEPPYMFGMQFLGALGAAIMAAVVLTMIWHAVRAAIRFDMRLLKSLSHHAALDRRR